MNERIVERPCTFYFICAFSECVEYVSV